MIGTPRPAGHGDHGTAAVVRAIEWMKANLSDPMRLTDLARAAAFSPFHFHRLFRGVTTMTPARFLAALRMAEARRLLLHSRLTTTAISVRVGYTSTGTFTTQFTRLVGTPPQRFRTLVRPIANTPAGALVPLLNRPAMVTPPGTLLRPDQAGPDELVLIELQTPVGAADMPDTWLLTVGDEPVQVTPASQPGNRRARVIAVDPLATVADALVDDVSDSYRVGNTRMPSPGGRLTVALRRPRPTDPPVLAATPLHRLADLMADEPRTPRGHRATGPPALPDAPASARRPRR